MTDHLIPLPAHFTYLNQFAPSQWAPNPSNARCGTASAAMLAEISYPGRWIPAELEHDLYVKMAGPDVPSDTNGIPKKPILDWFQSVGIGHVDMQDLLGNHDELKAELQAQNAQGVPQLIEILDMSHLHDAKTGAPLYTWRGGGAGIAHWIVRVGYSDNEGYGLYFDPASPGFSQPVPISWQNIVDAGIYSAVFVMPYRVPPVGPPPAGFRYTKGQWPTPVPPKPVFDQAKAELTLSAALTAAQATEAALANVLHDLQVLKGEV
jgi:hypothetical protein